MTSLAAQLDQHMLHTLQASHSQGSVSDNLNEMIQGRGYPPLHPISRSNWSHVQWDDVVSYWLIVGTLLVRRGTFVRYTQHEAGMTVISEGYVWRLIFYPEQWFWVNGFRILLENSCSGCWQYILRPYNVRSSRSPIFRACRERNLQRVRELLYAGEASPFDATSDGITPLHVSLCSQEMVLLLNCNSWLRKPHRQTFASC